MKYFIDTEFIERGAHFPIELISIAVVGENGESFYAISSEFDPSHANQWVTDNVLAHLELPEAFPRNSLREIAMMIHAFVSPSMVDGGSPEFWGYYSDYDWVVFCQLFGCMVDLPKGWPLFCRDLKQWCVDLGDPRLPEQHSAEHNALHDARWNLLAFRFLEEMANGTSRAPSALTPSEER